jgi:hypothetical protein
MFLLECAIQKLHKNAPITESVPLIHIQYQTTFQTFPNPPKNVDDFLVFGGVIWFWGGCGKGGY